MFFHQGINHVRVGKGCQIAQFINLPSHNFAQHAAHNFAGCIAGVNWVLYRQGLLASPLCLNPSETLSLGQAEEIERVRAWYPHLTDDDFVADFLAGEGIG